MADTKPKADPPVEPGASDDGWAEMVEAELARLQEENAELRARLDRADVVKAMVTPVMPTFISEGTRVDLELHGKANDPGTGAALELDRETGELTATPKGGEPVVMADVAALNQSRQ